MIKHLFILFMLLQAQFLIAQNRTLSPEKATELISSKKFDKIEPIGIDLDSAGVKIIRQFFYDKANYPDQVSKKQYLDNPYYSSWEKKNLSKFLKNLENPEYRTKAYTLTEADSLLLKRQKRDQRGMWRFSPIDTSIATNPYYEFFSFYITTARNTIPSSMIANGYESSGAYGATSPVAKMSAFIYDPGFTVAIPKINLNSSNNEQIELPLIILGKDFVSYRANLLLLENVLKESGYSDSNIRFSIVQLDAATNYSAKKIESALCQGFNLFNKKSCYKFNRLEVDYKVTMNKTHQIGYALVEEAENLKSYIRSVFKNSYYGSYSEIEFKSQKGRRFIYEIEYRDYKDYYYKRCKAVYNRGKVRFKLLN